MLDIERGQIFVITGRRGRGKTALLAYLAKLSNEAGIQTISNFDLYLPNGKGMPGWNAERHKMSLEDVAELPSSLQGCDVFLDEIHMGADARAIFHPSNQALSLLVSQIRKRDINLFCSTQRFDKLDARIRRETDFVVEIKRLRFDDNRNVQLVVVEREINEVIGRPRFDTSKAWDLYDTKEIIHGPREDRK